jgi:hypothetical protein
MLWEAVTRRRRWPTGLSQPALFTRLAAGEQPENPNAVSFGYPPEVDTLILKALAPKPADRFQTAAEMREALEKIVHALPPVSLRDLGTMLGTAFAEGRHRLRDIVEEQFKLIDAGGHPSKPHMLPAVIPPSLLTASESLDLPFPVGDGPAESLSRRMTAPALVRSALSPLRRSRLAIVIAATALGATAIALAIAGRQMRSGTGVEPTSTSQAAHDAVPSVPSPNPLATDSAQDARPRDESQGGMSSAASQPVESVPRSEWRNRPGGFPLPTHGPAPHSGPSAHETPDAVPVPPPPAPTASESPPNMTRTPQGRPRVQLERDNPWP